eukprot:PhM_4_TR499/c0_g1_i1/m.10252
MTVLSRVFINIGAVVVIALLLLIAGGVVVDAATQEEMDAAATAADISTGNNNRIPVVVPQHIVENVTDDGLLDYTGDFHQFRKEIVDSFDTVYVVLFTGYNEKECYNDGCKAFVEKVWKPLVAKPELKHHVKFLRVDFSSPKGRSIGKRMFVMSEGVPTVKVFSEIGTFKVEALKFGFQEMGVRTLRHELIKRLKAGAREDQLALLPFNALDSPRLKTQMRKKPFEGARNGMDMVHHDDEEEL